MQNIVADMIIWLFLIILQKIENPNLVIERQKRQIQMHDDWIHNMWKISKITQV